MSDLLILGAHGQVGCALTAHARRRGIAHRALGRAQCDITDRSALGRAIETARFVVNCAAYTAVDRAEQQIEIAYRVNAVAAENVAAACAKAETPLIHLSTDYVFDGENPEPWREDDPVRPLSVYGRSKLAGEIAIRSRLRSHIILRTSWIFSAHRQNFVKTILRLASTQPQLRVIADQIGGPTSADDIAKAILQIAAISGAPGFADWGTYHFSGAPSVSWYEFARAILVDHPTPVLPIATEDYPTPARRPRNSVLDCGRIFRGFAIEQPDWRDAMRKVLEELRAKI